MIALTFFANFTAAKDEKYFSGGYHSPVSGGFLPDYRVSHSETRKRNIWVASERLKYVSYRVAVVCKI